MRPRTAVSGAIVAALLLSACAAEKVVLAPTPPVEFRKEASPPPGGVIAPPRPATAVAPKPPDYPRMYLEAFARTKEAFRQGRVKDALPYWKALEESPWGRDAVFHQGVILHLAGEIDGASAIYRRLTDRSPIFEPAAANLLGICLLRGNLKEARSLIERILPGGAVPPPDMLPELQSNLGAALIETGDPDRAAGIFRAMHAKGTRSPSLTWNMAVLAYRDGDLAGARRMSSELPPEVGRLWPVIASRFAWERESGRIPPPGSVPASEQRISALAWNLSAFEEYRKGNLQGAEGLLAREKEKKTPFAAITGNLGLLQMEQGKLLEARRNLVKAVEDDPGLREGWLNLGVFREVYEGNTAGALECYRRYVKMNGSRKEEVNRWIEWLQKPSPPQ